jgi:hypothetical protein
MSAFCSPHVPSRSVGDPVSRARHPHTGCTGCPRVRPGDTDPSRTGQFRDWLDSGYAVSRPAGAPGGHRRPYRLPYNVRRYIPSFLSDSVVQRCRNRGALLRRVQPTPAESGTGCPLKAPATPCRSRALGLWRVPRQPARGARGRSTWPNTVIWINDQYRICFVRHDGDADAWRSSTITNAREE